MPLYEYECQKCGHRFEKIQKFSDKPVKKCTECGGAVHQVISAPAVQFKGSGWYVTDYAKKTGASASDGKDSKKEEKSKAEGSADSSSKDTSSKESPKESTSKEGSSKEPSKKSGKHK